MIYLADERFKSFLDTNQLARERLCLALLSMDKRFSDVRSSDVFHQALARLQSYEWRGVPFSAWLIRIAANAITDRWRRISHESDDPVPEDVEDTNAEDIEQCAALSQLVRDLPEDQRRIVILRFVEQKSIKEIAQEIRRTEGAVKQLQFRAVKKLRAQMEGADV